MRRRWFAVLSLLLASASLTCGQDAAPSGKPATAAEALSAAPLPGTSTIIPLSPGEVRYSDREADSSSRFWLNADYLLWWIKGTPSPPLVTTGAAPDPFAGALDQPNTRILFGGEKVEYDGRSGLRLNAGMWLNDDHKLAVEGSYFFLEQASRQGVFNSDANGDPLVTRPFTDAISGLQNVYFAAIDAALGGGAPLIGGVAVSTETKVRGYELNLVRPLMSQDNIKVSGLAGFRGMILKEKLNVAETVRDDVGGGLIFLGNLSAPGTTQNFLDSFETHNRFYGGQVGARLDWQRDRLNVSVTGKLALGSNEEITFINGATTQLTPNMLPQRVQGGVLAQSSNIGRHFDSDFAVIPELGVNFGYDVSSWLNLRAGYSFLYWSRVVRPGDQIDQTINTNLVPTDFTFGQPGGPSRPAFRNDKSDFWMHGINLGVEVKF